MTKKTKRSKKATESRKENYEDKYINGLKNKIIGVSEVTEVIIQTDAEKYHSHFKSHCEFILEQYALGNVRLRNPGTNLFMEVVRDKNWENIVRSILPPDKAQEIIDNIDPIKVK